VAKPKSIDKGNEISVALTIGERFKVMELLPEKGPIATVRLVRELADKLSLTQTEIKDHKVFSLPDGTTRWEDVKYERRFRFGGFELELVLSNLRKADSESRLTAAHVPIWDKFIPHAPEAK
jgi:hypothetical protein